MDEKLGLITELIKLARSDEDFREEEYSFIVAIASQLGLSESDIQPLFDEYIECHPPVLEFERILQFQRLILVANIDASVDKSELNFMRLTGLRMGLNPMAVEAVFEEMFRNTNGVIPPIKLINIFRTYHN
jgi:hypothetical protein